MLIKLLKRLAGNYFATKEDIHDLYNTVYALENAIGIDPNTTMAMTPHVREPFVRESWNDLWKALLTAPPGQVSPKLMEQLRATDISKFTDTELYDFLAELSKRAYVTMDIPKFVRELINVEQHYERPVKPEPEPESDAGSGSEKL